MIGSLIGLDLRLAYNQLRINVGKRHVQVSIILVGLTALFFNNLLNRFMQPDNAINYWIFNFFVENKETEGFILLIITSYYLARGFYGSKFNNMFDNSDLILVFNSKYSQREVYAGRFLSQMIVNMFYGVAIFLCILPVFNPLELSLIGEISLFLSFFIFFESSQLLSHISYNIRLNYNKNRKLAKKIITLLIIPICIFSQITYYYTGIISTNNIIQISLIFLILIATSFYLCDSYLNTITDNSKKNNLMDIIKVEDWSKKYSILFKDIVSTLRESGMNIFFEFTVGAILTIYFSYNFSLLTNLLPKNLLDIIIYYYPFLIIIIYYTFIPHIILLKNDISSYWLIKQSILTLKQYQLNKYLFFLISSTMFLSILIIISILSKINTTIIVLLFDTLLIYNLIGYYINSYSIIYLQISSENSFITNFLQIFSSLAFYIININLLQIPLNYLIILSILLIITISLRYERPIRYYFIEILSTFFLATILFVLLFGFLFFLWIQNWTSMMSQINNPLFQQIFVCFSSLSFTYIIFRIVDHLCVKNFVKAGSVA